MNSPRSANLAMLYTSEGINGEQQRPTNESRPSVVTSGDGLPTLSPQYYAYQASTGVASNVDTRRMSDADLLLNLHSPYPTPTPRQPNNMATTVTSPYVQNAFPQFQTAATFPYSGMMIESQDIDVSMLADDMMWLEYLPQDFTNAFGGNPS